MKTFKRNFKRKIQMMIDLANINFFFFFSVADSRDGLLRMEGLVVRSVTR